MSDIEKSQQTIKELEERVKKLEKSNKNWRRKCQRLRKEIREGLYAWIIPSDSTKPVKIAFEDSTIGLWTHSEAGEDFYFEDKRKNK